MFEKIYYRSGNSHSPSLIEFLTSPQDDLSFLDPPINDNAHLNVTPKDVFSAICSFRSGSAGGLGGLTSQHLKDMVCSSAEELSRRRSSTYLGSEKGEVTLKVDLRNAFNSVNKDINS